MKKMFLAALTALALCSYGYAQDDDEYEEDDAPARVVQKAPAVEEEEEEEAAPAPKKVEKKKVSKSEGGNGFFGIGLDLTGVIARNNAISLTFRLNDAMMLSAIFGFEHQGETTVDVNGQEQDQGDDNTTLSIGAAFDFILVKKFVPFSLGGEFVYNSLSEDDSRLDIGVLAGLHGEIAPNVILSGKVGPEFRYLFGDVGDNADYSKLNFGIAYKIYLTWFAF